MIAAKEMITEAVQGIENGDINALEGYLHLKHLNEILTHALKQVQPMAISEAETYGEKTFKAFGCEIQLKSAAGRYDFKHLPKWVELSAKIKDIQEDAKNAQKQAEKGKTVIDENGEIVEPAKYTPGKETIAIKTGVV